MKANDNQSTTLCPCSFLGYVDKLGVAYEAPTVATGFGAYLAQVSPFTCSAFLLSPVALRIHSLSANEELLFLNDILSKLY